MFPDLIARAEQALRHHMPAADTQPERLHQAMHHAVFAGGKRLRPLLVYATGEAAGNDGAALDAPACAVELIHTYSLIHDDLPAMDDDDMRRGKPTCHVVFGEAMAILAGDALQALAFEILARPWTQEVDAATRARMLQELAAACGSGGMAGGQALDLGAMGTRITLAELEHMHQCKTGALIRAAVRLGALAGGCRDEQLLEQLDRYAGALGLAFQIRDDILDVEADSTTLGKTAGKDARHAKPTFPVLIGIAASYQRLEGLAAEALAAIEDLSPAAHRLRELVGYCASRDH